MNGDEKGPIRAAMQEYQRERNKWYRVQRRPDADGAYRVFPLFGSLAHGDHAVWVSEGGWVGRRWLTTPELRSSRERWVQASYEHDGKALEKAREQEGGIIQCGGCRFFAALDGDFGLCCNPRSWFDGRATFEHGGCKQHSSIEEGLIGWDGQSLEWFDRR